MLKYFLISNEIYDIWFMKNKWYEWKTNMALVTLINIILHFIVYVKVCYNKYKYITIPYNIFYYTTIKYNKTINYIIVNYIIVNMFTYFQICNDVSEKWFMITTWYDWIWSCYVKLYEKILYQFQFYYILLHYITLHYISYIFSKNMLSYIVLNMFIFFQTCNDVSMQNDSW